MSNRKMRSGAKTASAKSRKQQRPGGSSAATGPMMFESNVRFHHRFRYTASTACVQEPITDTNCINTQGGICTVTNTELVPWVQSFKIKRIEVWASPASQGTNATVAVEWFGYGNSPNIEESNTTLSVSKNAYISCKPPQNSLAHFWQKNTGTQLFLITCPAHSIVDIVFDSIMNDDETNALVVIGTGVLGNTYYLALDHLTNNFLIPVSLVTTN
jgi:hypothetical protein